ncbi:lasso RiPP family leader peptide-containing protein [Micromonospora sp. CPCC 205561]|uniref:lasso RiPP family leader peptide-containing protein n=1 Tax=Micromonospora sp. CPCC 205561 TaxID=3122407 RepID=UPI002FF34A99
MEQQHDTETGRTRMDAAEYRAPTIQRLGTLGELTRGGTVGPDDGLGGQGDGSL